MSLCELVKKLLFFHRDSRGMTLVELLVALSIGSLVAAGATQILQQIFTLVPKAENSMLAMRQVQFAGHWIDRDATMAQAIAPTPDLFTVSTVTPLIISYVTEDTKMTTITYSVDADQKLQRQVVITNEITGSVISSSQTQVADSITSIQAQYTEPSGQEKKTLTVTIVAQIGGAAATRTYQTSPRSL